VADREEPERGTGQRLESRPVYDGRVVKLSVDRVRLPGGGTAVLELIRHPGAAAVVPLDENEQVLLVRQYRYATGGWLLEVPAGKLDAMEAPEACAAREMEEEIGCRPGRLASLGWIWTTPGFTLTVERLPLGEAVDRAGRGEIVDGKSVCALLRAARFLDAMCRNKKGRPEGRPTKREEGRKR
jgi:ADP-ribose pyrophosphatase